MFSLALLAVVSLLLQGTDAELSTLLGKKTLTLESLLGRQPIENLLGKENAPMDAPSSGNIVPCTCGVFLDKQMTRLSLNPTLLAGEEPIFSYPMEDGEPVLPGLKGRANCIKKCVDMAVRFAQQGPTLLCAALVDLNKQKAHLFIKNHDDRWHNTKLNSGREFCCKDGLPALCTL